MIEYNLLQTRSRIVRQRCIKDLGVCGVGGAASIWLRGTDVVDK